MPRPGTQDPPYIRGWLRVVQQLEPTTLSASSPASVWPLGAKGSAAECLSLPIYTEL